jgi:hypothetical protein
VGHFEIRHQPAKMGAPTKLAEKIPFSRLNLRPSAVKKPLFLAFVSVTPSAS